MYVLNPTYAQKSVNYLAKIIINNSRPQFSHIPDSLYMSINKLSNDFYEPCLE